MKTRGYLLSVVALIFLTASLCPVIASSQDYPHIIIRDTNGVAIQDTTTVAKKKGLKPMVKKANNMLSTSYNTVNYDTMYIGRPTTKFLLKTQLSLSGFKYKYKNKFDDSIFEAKFHTSTNTNLHLGLTYLGFTLGFSFNPTTAFMHKNSEYEIGFTYYSNSCYFDINYYKSTTFRGLISFDDFKLPFDKGAQRVRHN